MAQIKEKTAELSRMRIIGTSRPPIPKSWNEMAGAFKNKRRALLLHAKNIRKEWGKSL